MCISEVWQIIPPPCAMAQTELGLSQLLILCSPQLLCGPKPDLYILALRTALNVWGLQSELEELHVAAQLIYA